MQNDRIAGLQLQSSLIAEDGLAGFLELEKSSKLSVASSSGNSVKAERQASRAAFLSILSSSTGSDNENLSSGMEARISASTTGATGNMRAFCPISSLAVSMFTIASVSRISMISPRITSTSSSSLIRSIRHAITFLDAASNFKRHGRGVLFKREDDPLRLD